MEKEGKQRTEGGPERKRKAKNMEKLKTKEKEDTQRKKGKEGQPWRGQQRE